ncbi:MAG: sulfotransferase [Chloroflexi bacterium]|nr:sulfotransferase [Chloroflexota bacterium]
MSTPCTHIFLVGLPRSGTTLMTAMLNASTDIGISIAESHYLARTRGSGRTPRPSFREKIDAAGDLATEAGLRKIVDLIYDEPELFWRPIVAQMDRAEFCERLMQSDRTHRALFELAMRIHAGRKPICGEKTPGHVLHVPTLLEWFPDAKIVNIVRDPRATYVSQIIKRETHNRGLAGSALRRVALLRDLVISTGFIRGWNRALGLHLKYQARYPDQYRLVRYEDVVTQPETTLRELCRFLGVEFSDGMVTGQVNLNSSYTGARQASGIDTQAIDRWRAHMSPLIRQWFNLWCNKPAGRYGYVL